MCLISACMRHQYLTKRQSDGQLLDGGDQVSATSSGDVERIEFFPLTNTISHHLLHLLQPPSHLFHCSSSPINAFSPPPSTSVSVRLLSFFFFFFYTFPSHHSTPAPCLCVGLASEDVKVTGWQNIYRVIKPLQEKKHTKGTILGAAFFSASDRVLDP